ncbi:glycosyl hydrolase-related protein, partial [Pauljensenia sp. UMB6358]|uniref:glycosyl hydrolase-related protein n=1 Tax=Pauljensenia sp. UMB6358 TaxID=3046335 RepID=UPI00255177D5
SLRQTVERGYALAQPLTAATGEGEGATPLLRSVEGIVIEAVKWAEDGSGFIVRGYEPLGQRAGMSLEFGYDVESVKVVNVLEEDAADLAQIEVVGNR